jgi:predicted PhzF superfamily epimerase YddE/YHI9
LTPLFSDILTLSDELDVIGLYIVAGDEARMFAPRYGINEESATGVGAGAYALVRFAENKTIEMTINQGHLMTPSSPSTLQVTIRNGGKEIWVAGSGIIEDSSILTL